MNLLVCTQNNLIKNNYSSNINFKSKANKAVYKRSAKEIENYISLDNGIFDRKSIEDILCDMVGKCLGDKYLFQIVGNVRSSALWLAIHNNTTKAIDVILRILKAHESQGKTCNEIVDKMLEELKVKKGKKEVLPIKDESISEPKSINDNMTKLQNINENIGEILENYKDIKLTPAISEAIVKKIGLHK